MDLASTYTWRKEDCNEFEAFVQQRKFLQKQRENCALVDKRSMDLGLTRDECKAILAKHQSDKFKDVLDKVATIGVVRGDDTWGDDNTPYDPKALKEYALYAILDRVQEMRASGRTLILTAAATDDGSVPVGESAEG